MPEKQIAESFVIVTLRKAIRSPAEGDEFYEKIRMEFFDDKSIIVNGQTSTHFKTVME